MFTFKSLRKKKQSSIVHQQEGASRGSYAILKTASSLAMSTTTSALSLDFNNSYKYLCASGATKLDTVLFSCFILRAICIMSTRNRVKAVAFSNEYVSSVTNLAKDLFFDSFNPSIVDSRFAFYDRVFAKPEGFEKSISAVMEEFEYIIKTDINQDRFAPFSESSPLPILGFDADLHCSIEVNSYFKFLLANVKEVLDESITVIQ